MSEAVELPPIIPRELLFGNPERNAPALSPDGSLLAWTAPDENDVLQIHLRPVGDDGEAKVVTRDKKRGIRSYQWSRDGQCLLYLQDSDGDENWHVFAVDHELGATRDLTPWLGAQAHIIKTSKAHPSEILVSMNVRNPQLHEVYRVDLTTGGATIAAENPGDVVGWLADDELRVLGAQAVGPDGGFIIRTRRDESAEWQDTVTVGPEDSDTAMLAFDKGGEHLYLSSSVGGDTLRLVRKSLATGEETVLAESGDSDLQEVLFEPDTKEVLAVAFGRARLDWRAMQDSVKADLTGIAAVHDGDPVIVSRTADDRTWLVAFTTDAGPVPYYTWSRDSGAAELLFTSRPKLEDCTLARMTPVEIKARDGLSLPSYLTLPAGIPAKGLPLVLNVHGGPWARDHWGYNPECQWLANRGYAVLQVNYRGSTGFGKSFLHAADREWGAKMHDDLLDAVQWAVDEGYADKDKVAIYGGSYGGYAALVGAAFTPEVFCCAVDIVGPSSIETLLNSFPPYWEPLKKMFESRVGGADETEFLRSRSPLFKADQIRIPLLIAQGANDPRVKQAESEQIVEAVRKNGKEVEYMLFEDEGHGFARPENRMIFYAAAERFLARHLGGRCEPAGETPLMPVSAAD